MDFSNVFKIIKDNFSPRKSIDFKDADLHFEIEPLTTKEEIIVIEACKDVDGSSYIETLKRHTLACSIKKMNDIELGESIEYTDSDGEKIHKSKYLYMLDFISGWPSSLVDLLFNAYSDMSQAIDTKIQEDAKFERFHLSEETEEDKPEKLKREQETSPIGMTETEQINEQVKKEIDEQTSKIAETESEALKKHE